jgi:hypothetical protein
VRNVVLERTRSPGHHHQPHKKEHEMPEHDNPFGPWFKIVTALAKLGLDLAGVPGAGAGVELVAVLVGVEDDEKRLLNAIKNDTRLLREGDFTAARLLLQEANRVGAQDARYIEFLKKSTDLLYRAHGLVDSISERSIVEFHLALVWLALGSLKDAQHWIEQCLSSANSELNHLISDMQRGPERFVMSILDKRVKAGTEVEAGDTQDEPKRGGAGWLVPGAIAAGAAAGIGLALPMAFVGATTIASYRTKQQARLSKLREYLNFYNAAEAMSYSIKAQNPPSPLVIISVWEGAVPPDGQGAALGNVIAKLVYSRYIITREPSK